MTEPTPVQRLWAQNQLFDGYDHLLPPPNVMQVLGVVTHLCAINPWVIIFSIGETIALVFWSILSPNWKDQVRIATGRSWVHHGRMLMEEAHAIKPSVVNRVGSVLLDFAELADAEAFYMACAAAAGEGLIEASSLIWQFNGCHPKPTDHGLYSKHNLGIINFHDGWHPATAWDNVKRVNSLQTVIGYEFTFPKGSGGNVTFALRYDGPGGMPFPINARLRDTGSGEIIAQDNWNPEHQNPKWSSLVVAKGINAYSAARTVIMEVQAAVPWEGIAVFSSESGNYIALEWATLE